MSPHGRSTDRENTARLDYAKSSILATLTDEDAVSSFGGMDGALAEYSRVLPSNSPRLAAFLMKAILGMAIDQDNELAEAIMMKYISQLPTGDMGDSAKDIVAKVTKPSTRPRAMFSSSHWLTGGMERVMATLFEELKKDYDIYLITPYHERASNIPIPAHVTNIKIANSLFTQHFDSIILTYALLLRVDVVVGFVNMFNKQTNLYKLCEGTGIKTIASNHEYYLYPYKSKFHYREVEQRLSAFSKADAVLWANNLSAALCGAYIDNSYVIGNPNAYDVSTKTRASSNENVIICVGRFNDTVKRVDRMIAAFSLVLQNVPDTKLLLVGRYDNDEPPGISQDQINALIHQHGIKPECVEFAGEVSKVQDYYLRSKVLMITSESEGFGMTINEAGCFGVPAVCNYFPGVEDLISNGENGFITKQGDVKEMSERLTDILLTDVHDKLSLQARRMASRYGAEEVGNDWRFLIDTLLDTKQGAKGVHETLKARIGYHVNDKDKMIQILASELNEIFYQFVRDDSDQVAVSRAPASLYIRLKSSVRDSGLKGTLKKLIVKLQYRIRRR